jgi:predicted anti-sigma-YlaC factor YlaD
MTPEIKRHLTDEALDDVLIGLGSLVSQAHLAQCPQCRARVESFQSSVSLFNQASLAYSEAQPVKTLSASQPARRFHVRPVIAAWTAAVILLVVMGPAALHLFIPHPVHAPAVATETRDTETQIAEDNELLRQVSAAIAPDEQYIIEQYQMMKGPSPRGHSKMRTE